MKGLLTLLIVTTIATSCHTIPHPTPTPMPQPIPPLLVTPAPWGNDYSDWQPVKPKTVLLGYYGTPVETLAPSEDGPFVVWLDTDYARFSLDCKNLGSGKIDFRTKGLPIGLYKKEANMIYQSPQGTDDLRNDYPEVRVPYAQSMPRITKYPAWQGLTCPFYLMHYPWNAPITTAEEGKSYNPTRGWRFTVPTFSDWKDIGTSLPFRKGAVVISSGIKEAQPPIFPYPTVQSVFQQSGKKDIDGPGYAPGWVSLYFDDTVYRIVKISDTASGPHWFESIAARDSEWYHNATGK